MKYRTINDLEVIIQYYIIAAGCTMKLPLNLLLCFQTFLDNISSVRSTVEDFVAFARTIFFNNPSNDKIILLRNLFVGFVNSLENS